MYPDSCQRISIAMVSDLKSNQLCYVVKCNITDYVLLSCLAPEADDGNTNVCFRSISFKIA